MTARELSFDDWDPLKSRVFSFRETSLGVDIKFAPLQNLLVFRGALTLSVVFKVLFVCPVISRLEDRVLCRKQPAAG